MRTTVISPRDASLHSHLHIRFLNCIYTAIRYGTTAWAGMDIGYVRDLTIEVYRVVCFLIQFSPY